MAFLKHSKDFDAINTHALKIDEKETLLGAASLSPEENVVKNIWNSLGVIENGSFQYFFECQMNIDYVKKSFELIGMEDVAKLFFQVETILLPVAAEPDWLVRLRVIQENEQKLDALAGAVLRHTVEIERKLFQYIQNAEVNSTRQP